MISSLSQIPTLLLAIMMTYIRSIPFALFALFGTGLAQTVDGSNSTSQTAALQEAISLLARLSPSLLCRALLQRLALLCRMQPILSMTIRVLRKLPSIATGLISTRVRHTFGLRIWMSTATALTTSARYGEYFCLIGILLLTRCAGKPDGQHQINFGALAAYEVPFLVIPDRFGTKCSTAFTISSLLARTDSVLPSNALNKNYVTNFSTLRPMGDKLMTALVKNLKLVDGGDGCSPTTTAGSNLTSESCEGEGHCAGASCKDENACSGHLVCKSGKCASE
ncbi:unnamed protein product [Penicillium nalgiovense]|nr:unnamed protein product [Penicillium nalgiovense]